MPMGYLKCVGIVIKIYEMKTLNISSCVPGIVIEHFISDVLI